MKIFLGDNQFLGINHASESRAIERAIKFQDVFAISEIVKTAQLLGYDGFFCTLHEKFIPFYKLCSVDEVLQKMPIHACLPYAHKYSEMVTQHGWLGSLKHLGKNNAGNLILGGVSAYLGKDLTRLIRGVIGSELSFVKDLNLESIYIQNVATDFLLGLGAFDYSSIAPEIENSSKENLVVIEWVPQKIDINKKYFSEEGKGKSIRNDDEDNQSRVSLVCAGYDSSFIVTESSITN